MIPQWPLATRVTVLPETAQIVGVVDAKLTGSPDDAVADTVNGGLLSDLLGRAAKLIVCATLVIWKACVTGVAAA